MDDPQEWIYWKLTHLRDKAWVPGWMRVIIDYLRYDVFHPEDDTRI